MKKLLLFLMFISPILAISQHKGIAFEHKTNWEAVLSKAKKENKMIFVDCFTSWCGPCKWMEQNTFINDTVGEFMNEKFVSLKIQFDKTKNDSEDIKSWYEKATEIQTNYNVETYPTYLIFDSSGKLLDRHTGSMPANDFITKLKLSLDPTKQYERIKTQVREKPNNIPLLSDLFNASLSNGDFVTFDSVYLVLEKLLTEKEFLQERYFKGLCHKASKGINNNAFKIVRNNTKLIDDYLIANKVKYNTKIIMEYAIRNYYFLQDIQVKTFNEINYDSLQNFLINEYPEMANDLPTIITSEKLSHISWSAQYEFLEKVINEELARNPKFNIYSALSRFYYGTNFKHKYAVRFAIKTLKKFMDEQGETPSMMNLYARFLFINKDFRDALLWQQKAVEKASQSQKEEFEKNLAEIESVLNPKKSDSILVPVSTK